MSIIWEAPLNTPTVVICLVSGSRRNRVSGLWAKTSALGGGPASDIEAPLLPVKIAPPRPLSLLLFMEPAPAPPSPPLLADAPPVPKSEDEGVAVQPKRNAG